MAVDLDPVDDLGEHVLDHRRLAVGEGLAHLAVQRVEVRLGRHRGGGVGCQLSAQLVTVLDQLVTLGRQFLHARSAHPIGHATVLEGAQVAVQ
ncbi:MAG TPA: hypothetical protein VGA36_04920, partial [Nitriliruptorales bacterium]